MPLTCLIAAHDPWFIQLLRMFVEESGFHPVQVYEGQDVLPMARKEQPVAVVMQADLPGKRKGDEILRDLLNDPETSHIPVLLIMFQGHGTGGEAPSERPQGAAAYLQDPVTYESFQDALRKAGVNRPGSTRIAGHSHSDLDKLQPKISHDKLN